MKMTFRRRLGAFLLIAILAVMTACSSPAPTPAKSATLTVEATKQAPQTATPTPSAECPPLEGPNGPFPQGTNWIEVTTGFTVPIQPITVGYFRIVLVKQEMRVFVVPQKGSTVGFPYLRTPLRDKNQIDYLEVPLSDGTKGTSKTFWIAFCGSKVWGRGEGLEASE